MKFTKFFYYSSLVGAVLCFVFAFFCFLGFSMNSSVDTFATVFRFLIIGAGTLLIAFLLKEILSLEEKVQRLETQERFLNTAMINLEGQTRNLESNQTTTPSLPSDETIEK